MVIRALLFGLLSVAALVVAAPPIANAESARPWSRITRPPIPRPMPQVFYEPCPGMEELAGCHFGVDDAAEDGRVFPRGAIFVRGLGRFTKLHELGHAFDETMLDASERDEYTRLRGMRDLLWTWSEGLEDGTLVQAMGSPAEDFADAYASCRMQHTPWGLWESGYGYYPTPREHWRVCRMIARAAEDPGTPVSADGDR